MSSAFIRTSAVCLAFALLTLAGYSVLHAQSPAAAPPARPMLVRDGARLVVPASSPLRTRLLVAAVGAQAGASRVTLPAVVEAEPARTVNIQPPLAGRVVALYAHLGQTVRRGELLARIASGDYAQALADVKKARDALSLSQQALARAQAVNLAGSNAVKDVEGAQGAVDQDRAELERSQARLSALQPLATSRRAADSALLQVVSPINGIVTALNVGIGAVLNDATAVMMTVSNLEEVWVTVNVPENLLGEVATGQKVSVELLAYRDKTFTGRVSQVSPILDTDTRRTRARVPFANAGLLLKPNMYASAVVELAPAAHPEVPTSSLVMNNDSTSVFVEVQPWVFERRAVEAGREDGDRVAIRHGVAVGERIVVRGGVLLND